MRKRGRIKAKKGAIETDMLTWWIIGAAVLIVMAGGLLLLSGKWSSAINYFKNLLRFGT